MNIIRFSIENPVTVIVGILLVVMFGVIALQQIPIQLSPSVEEPVITVTTVWPGATPYEIERDIIEEQEKTLKGIPGLYELESTSSNGLGTISLRFKIGTDIDNALLRTSNKLDEVPEYPENVDRPVINASGAESSPVMWIMLKTAEGNDRNVYEYLTYFENEVRQYLDRVEGVADLFIGGGTEREMHVFVDPERLAAYNLTIERVANALQAENANISAGNQDVGRREYRIRSVAEYNAPEEIMDVIIVSDAAREVRVRDIGRVDFGYDRLTTPVISKYAPGIAIGVRPEPNTNILNMTDRVEAVVNELNDGVLKDEDLFLQIVNEQRPYIRGAIALLQQNIAIGGGLAVIVLLLFLRSISPTIVVATAIPISIIGTFMVMYGAGSTLNVVSLAGIAFAVGMLVDNAIVVLENIDRHRKMGKHGYDAAYDGTKEVWGAVLASSLTTVAVFLPVIFLEDEAGQLFRDIALAVCAAVLLSLVVAMTVIPMLSRQVYDRLERKEERLKAQHKEKKKRTGPLMWIGNGASAFIMGLVKVALAHWTTRLATILLLVGSAGLTAWALTPKMEYLPTGNRDLIINVLIPPPGLSFEERMEIGEKLFDHMRPYYDAQVDPYPKIRHMFYVGRGGALIFGVISSDQMRTRDLLPLCQEATGQIPGIFAISNQASIFQSGLGEGRTVSVDLSGNNIPDLVSTAGQMLGMVRGEIEDVQVRPVPSLDLAFPEANFIPDRERLRAVGMSAREFGVALDVMMDGREIAEYKEEGKKKIDLILKVDEQNIATPEDLYQALMVTATGDPVPVAALSTMEKTSGLTEIRHLERDRTVTLQVTPPRSITIQETMERINENIIPALREQGKLEGISVGMSGTADKLTETRQALQGNFLVAALIAYLLMSALLSNFFYPFVIMFTVPLAGAGGLIGLKLLNVFIAQQSLDILTMLGFIILVGIVVNNAILIVYQSLENLRENNDMTPHDAVLEAVRTRLRPIYMSASTSVFGMFPIVVWPGPGSELYRGLGSVILGGLAISTIFTIFLIPSILLFFLRAPKPAKRPEEVAPDTAATAEA
jgi:HAE1 family hydrophobic/amphiphilic exporter-1